MTHVDKQGCTLPSAGCRFGFGEHEARWHMPLGLAPMLHL